MFCTQCGTLNTDTTRFCTSCGAILKPEGAPSSEDATVVDFRPAQASVQPPAPHNPDLDVTVVPSHRQEAAPIPPNPYFAPAPSTPVQPSAPMYVDPSSAGSESATMASLPSAPPAGQNPFPAVPAAQVPAAAPIYPAPAYPAPAYPAPAYPPPAYPAQAAYPNGAYANGVYPTPAGAYQQPSTQPRAAASGMGLPWFLNRLPVIGGLLTVIGFVLNWFTSAGSSGLNQVGGGLNALGYLFSNGAEGIPFDQMIFYMILPLLTVLALIAGIFGLLGFLARKGLRLPTTILAVLGLAVVFGYMLMFPSYYAVDFGGVVSAWSFGFYLLLVGLLWTAVTPWFSKTK